MALDARPPQQRQFAAGAMSTSQLLHYRGPDQLNVSIELHKRFAFPIACIALALVGHSDRDFDAEGRQVGRVRERDLPGVLRLLSLVGVADRRGAAAASCRLW